MAMKTLFQPGMATSNDAPRAPSGGVAAGGSEEHQAPPELHLNAEHIKALGWKPKAGARHTIHAEVVVHRVGSENDSSSEPRRSERLRADYEAHGDAALPQDGNGQGWQRNRPAEQDQDV